MTKTLGDVLKERNWRRLRDIYVKIRKGELEVEDPDPPGDFATYLTRLDYALWYWTSLIILFLAALSVYTSNTIIGMNLLRVILGSIVVLFLPGYATIETLYPDDKDLSNLERLALSIGLSLAVVPLIGLVLNYTPWGIRLNPIVTTLTIYTTTILTIAAYRKYQTTRKKSQAKSLFENLKQQTRGKK